MTFPHQVKYVLIGKETSWGTPVVPTKDTGLLLSDPGNSVDKEIIKAESVGIVEDLQLNEGMKDPKNSLEGDIVHTRLFDYLFGSVGHAQTGSDWTHTFTINNNTASATIEAGNDSTNDAVVRNAGEIIESATFGFALNENLKLATSWVGKDFALPGSAQSAIISLLPVFPHSLCNALVNGVAAEEVQNASISVTLKVERSGGGGSNTYVQGHRTKIQFEWSALVGFSDDTYNTHIKNQTITNFAIEGDNAVALGSGKRQVKLALKSCQEKTHNEVTSVGNLTFVEIGGEGLFDTAVGIDDISDVNF